MAPEQILSLGEFLRQERERRGITIEQVASATKIGVRLLHSLEADQFAELPAKPFIRGFVISYCRFVGMDPKEVLGRFADFIEAKAHDRPTREGGHSGYAFEKREGEQSRTVLWFVMGGFLVLGGLIVFFLKPTLRHPHGSHADKLRALHAGIQSPSPEPSPSASGSPLPSPSASAVAVIAPSPSSSPPSSKPSATPRPSPSPSVKAKPRPSPKPSPSPSDIDPLNSGVGLKSSEIQQKIVFKTTERVWVRYQVDDRSPMRFVLKKGGALVLRAHESVKFQVSNPKALSVRTNGGPTVAVTQSGKMVMRQNDATLFFPSQLADSIDEPFPGEKPLSSLPLPVGRSDGAGDHTSSTPDE